jgi:predicted glycoside hydrolase/deacetylase ChbG (UPF0249 family)
MRWLVVNADDFGHSDEVNEGVLLGHVEGIVTSASLMVDGTAAEAAAARASEHPGLGLGLHLDLGEWMYRHGRWESRYVIVDTDDAAAVEVDVARQILRFRELVGTDPEHLDSHQHVHRDEPVRTIAKRWASRLGIPLRHYSAARYCGAFYGQGRGGEPLAHAITAPALANLVAELPDGVTELCCHPAAAVPPRTDYANERSRELASLCDSRVHAAIASAGVQLGPFREALAFSTFGLPSTMSNVARLAK